MQLTSSLVVMGLISVFSLTVLNCGKLPNKFSAVREDTSESIDLLAKGNETLYASFEEMLVYERTPHKKADDGIKKWTVLRDLKGELHTDAPVGTDGVVQSKISFIYFSEEKFIAIPQPEGWAAQIFDMKKFESRLLKYLKKNELYKSLRRQGKITIVISEGKPKEARLTFD